MTEALKPCPFCGGEASIRIDTSHSTACLIGCATVGCFGHEQWEETEAEAITAWNRRTPDMIPRADAELAVSEAIRRAAEAGQEIANAARANAMTEKPVSKARNDMMERCWGAEDAVRAILALAPADALADVQRLRARVTSLSEQVDTIAEQRDAALARVARLRSALSMIEGNDSHIDASIRSSGETRVIVHGDCGRIARAALDEDARHG